MKCNVLPEIGYSLMILLRNKNSRYTLFIYNEYKSEIITYLAMLICLDEIKLVSLLQVPSNRQIVTYLLMTYYNFYKERANTETILKIQHLI